MIFMYRYECRGIGCVRNGQIRVWRKSVLERKSIIYKVLGEKLIFGECKNYSEYGIWGGNYRGVEVGNEVEEESGGFINYIKGFECYFWFYLEVVERFFI